MMTDAELDVLKEQYRNTQKAIAEAESLRAALLSCQLILGAEQRLKGKNKPYQEHFVFHSKYADGVHIPYDIGMQIIRDRLAAVTEEITNQTHP